jgi:hypothetical protein
MTDVSLSEIEKIRSWMCKNLGEFRIFLLIAIIPALKRKEWIN